MAVIQVHVGSLRLLASQFNVFHIYFYLGMSEFCFFFLIFLQLICRLPVMRLGSLLLRLREVTLDTYLKSKKLWKWSVKMLLFQT